MYKLTIIKGKDIQEMVFQLYWQALTTAIRAQNLGYETKIEGI